MSVVIKTESQLDAMRAAGKILASIFIEIEAFLKVGNSTLFIDNEIYRLITEKGGKPSFLGYRGYKHSSCISVNEQIVHGIPTKEKILMPGDICSVDIGVYYKGFHVDAARTYPIEAVSDQADALIKAAEAAFFDCMSFCKEGNRLGDMSHALQSSVESKGFSVIRDLYSHGVGKNLHEDPLIPNFGKPGKGLQLKQGMTFAIEPMISIGTFEVLTLEDKWTIITADRKWAAHYENTVVVGLDGPEILTL